MSILHAKALTREAFLGIGRWSGLLYRLAAQQGVPLADKLADTLGRRRVDAELAAQVDVPDIEPGVARIGKQIGIGRHGGAVCGTSWQVSMHHHPGAVATRWRRSGTAESEFGNDSPAYRRPPCTLRNCNSSRDTAAGDACAAA